VDGRAVKRRGGESERARSVRGRARRRPKPTAARAGHSRSLSGRRGNGADSAHARLYSAWRTGFAGRRRGQTLGRGRRAVLTAGRSERRAPAGARREAARPAGAFSHAVAVSLAASRAVPVAVSIAVPVATATRRWSCAVTSASCSTASSTSSPAPAASSTLCDRGTCHEGDDCQAEDERAKSGHMSEASFEGADQLARHSSSIRDATFQGLP